MFVPNIGVETSIGKKSTFQFDLTGSFWKSIDDKPTRFYIFIPEYRCHFHEKINGLCIGDILEGLSLVFKNGVILIAINMKKDLGML